MVGKNREIVSYELLHINQSVSQILDQGTRLDQQFLMSVSISDLAARKLPS